MSGSGEEDVDDPDDVFFSLRDLFRYPYGEEEIEYFDAIENALADHLRGLDPMGRGALLRNLRQQYDYGDGGNPREYAPPGDERIDEGEEEEEEDEDESELNTERSDDDDDDEELMVDAIGQDPGGGDNQGDRVGLVQLGLVDDEMVQQELVNIRSPRRIASPPAEASRSFHSDSSAYTATSGPRTGHSVTMSQATASSASSQEVNVTSVAAASQPVSAATQSPARSPVTSPPVPDPFFFDDSDTTPYGTPDLTTSPELSSSDIRTTPEIEATTDFVPIQERGGSTSDMRTTPENESATEATQIYESTPERDGSLSDLYRPTAPEMEETKDYEFAPERGGSSSDTTPEIDEATIYETTPERDGSSSDQRTTPELETPANYESLPDHPNIPEHSQEHSTANDESCADNERSTNRFARGAEDESAAEDFASFYECNRSDDDVDNDQIVENNEVDFYECEGAIGNISNSIERKASSSYTGQEACVQDGFVTPPTVSDNEDVFEECYINNSGDAHFPENPQGNTYASGHGHCCDANERVTFDIDVQNNQNNGNFQPDSSEESEGSDEDFEPGESSDESEDSEWDTEVQEKLGEYQAEGNSDPNDLLALGIDEQSNQNNGYFEAESNEENIESEMDSTENTAGQQEENSAPQAESNNDGTRECSRNCPEPTSPDATNFSATSEHLASPQPQFTDSFSILNPMSPVTPRPLTVNPIASSHSLINLEQQVFGTALLERNNRDTTVGLCLQDNTESLEHFAAAQDTGNWSTECVFGVNPLDALEYRFFHGVGAHQSLIHNVSSQDSHDRSSSLTSFPVQHVLPSAATQNPNDAVSSRTAETLEAAETSSNIIPPTNPEDPASLSTAALAPPATFNGRSMLPSPASLGENSNPPTTQYSQACSSTLNPGALSVSDNVSHPLSPSPPDRTAPPPPNNSSPLNLDTLQPSDVWLLAGPSNPQAANPFSQSAAQTLTASMECDNYGTVTESNPDLSSYVCLSPLPDILSPQSPSAPGTSSARTTVIVPSPRPDLLTGTRVHQGPVEESEMPEIPSPGSNYQILPRYSQEDQYYSLGSTPDLSLSPDYPATPDLNSTPEMMSEDDDEEDSLDEAELGIAAEQALYEEARFDEILDEARIAAEQAEQEHLLDDEDRELSLRQNELLGNHNDHQGHQEGQEGQDRQEGQGRQEGQEGHDRQERQENQEPQEQHLNNIGDDDDDISYQLVQPIRVEPEGAAQEEVGNDNDNDDEGYIDDEDDNIAAHIVNGAMEEDGDFQVIFNGQVISAEHWRQWVQHRVNNPPARNSGVDLEIPGQRENEVIDGAAVNHGFVQNVMDDDGNIYYTIYGINLGDDGQVVQGVFAHPNPGMDDIEGDDELSDDGPVIGPLYTLNPDTLDPNITRLDPTITRLDVQEVPAIEQAPPEPEPEENGIDWSLLPMNVVTEIMCYLSDADRVRMAKTCKKWYSLLNSACLWRIRIIRFHGSGTKAKAEAKRLKGWATRHGNWLQRLSIYCDHPSYVVCRTFQKAMTDFFGTLLWQKTALRRFCMRRLYVERYWRYDTVRERLVGSLSRFLKRQSHLQYIDLSDGHWGLLNGLKILEAVAQGCKGNRRLMTLNLEDFFSSRLSLFSLARYQNVLTKFKGLCEVYTNYSCVSDEIVETLARNCEGRLKLLSVKIYRTEPHTHTVAPGTWRLATRLCRALRVEVYIEGMGNFDDIGGILVKDMPLRMLQIWTGIHPVDQNWRTDRLFQHVATHYAATIEEAYMSVEPEGEAIDSAVVEMLEKCKLLDSVDLQTTLEVDTLETIYQKVNERKILATRLHINLNNLTGVEMEMLEAVNERWAPMVDERRLNYVFEANELVLF